MAIFNEDKLFELLNEGSINLNKNPIKIKGVTMIIVHSNEGDNIPHFHIKRDNCNDCCIMFNENRYFNHGNNDSLLSAKEARELNSWLHKLNYKDNSKTNFQVLGDMWNGAGGVRTLANTDREFDYSNIAMYKN